MMHVHRPVKATHMPRRKSEITPVAASPANRQLRFFQANSGPPENLRVGRRTPDGATPSSRAISPTLRSPARRARLLLLARRDRMGCRCPARLPGVLPVSQHPPRHDHRTLPFQGCRVRRRRRNPDCRDHRRHRCQAGTTRPAALGVLLPVPVFRRLLGGTAVLWQPAEGGAAPDRAGGDRRAERARGRHRRDGVVRFRRGHRRRPAVGRHDAVRRTRHRTERDRRAADS